MRFRGLTAGAAALCAMISAGLPAGAADLPTAKSAPALAPVMPGWTFTVTPYFWFASVSTKVNLALPNGGTVSQTYSLDPGQVLSNLRFGYMSAAEADYDRFALLTDLVYANLGLNGSNARLGDIHRPDGTISVPVSSQSSVGTGAGALVWTTAGGYSLGNGPWGDIKAILGFRLLNLQTNTWYALSSTITGPRGDIALSKNGDLSSNTTAGYGVVGFTGRFNVPNTSFYIPYYADAGSGSSPLTWQGFTGLGYKYKGVDLSLGYRYLSFENSTGKPVQSFNLGGAIATATFHF